MGEPRLLPLPVTLSGRSLSALKVTRFIKGFTAKEKSSVVAVL